MIMTLTIDRIKHSLAVARKMKKIVNENPNEYIASPDDAFIIGILHDIGYEFVDDQKKHAHKGGVLLREQGFKYWREIYYHGIPQDEFNSKELWLLNYVDMITSPTGECVTVPQRISDISTRYGEKSWQKKEAVALSIMLKDKGWI